MLNHGDGFFRNRTWASVCSRGGFRLLVFTLCGNCQSDKKHGFIL